MNLKEHNQALKIKIKSKGISLNVKESVSLSGELMEASMYYIGPWLPQLEDIMVFQVQYFEH